MADTSVVTNPGAGGASWATATDGSSFNHLKVIIETESAGAPVTLSTSNPLPANIAQVGASAVSLGSKVSASSIPVVIASDQGAIPALQSGSWTVTVNGTVTANIGTTNGLALDSSINGILLSQASTTSGQKGPLVQGAVTTGAPTYTTGQTSPLSLTTAGALRVDGSAVTQPVSGTFWQATQPVSGTFWQATQPVSA